MEFSENFANAAGELMDSILADTDVSPTITPFLSLGTNDPSAELMDGPISAQQASANDLFQAFDDGAPSLDRMKRAGMHHDEAFEL